MSRAKAKLQPDFEYDSEFSDWDYNNRKQSQKQKQRKFERRQQRLLKQKDINQYLELEYENF